MDPVYLREAGLLERPRGGHRGERVLAAKGRVRTSVIIAGNDGFGQRDLAVRTSQTDQPQTGRQASRNLETD